MLIDLYTIIKELKLIIQSKDIQGHITYKNKKKDIDVWNYF